MTGAEPGVPAAVVPRRAAGHVLAALAMIAAQADGHGPCTGFRPRTDGQVGGRVLRSVS